MQIRRTILISLTIILIACCSAVAQTSPPRSNYPTPIEGDFVVKDFKFKSAETLPELKLHYRTIGTPTKDNNGVVRNAVLIMHGTGELVLSFYHHNLVMFYFGPGQLLDATKFFIILPDAIGHGGSSKPSDGLHSKFPHYTYDDMVLAQYRVTTENWSKPSATGRWALDGCDARGFKETYPDFMDALMPLASAPVEIAGRNRIMRKMIMDAIRNDPAWNNAEYKTQPIQGLTCG